MHLKQSSGNAILRLNSDTGEKRVDFGNTTDDDAGRIKYSSDGFSFWTNGTRRFEISETSYHRIIGNGDGYAYLEIDTNTADKGQWRFQVDSNPATAKFYLQDYSGGAWNTNLTVDHNGQLGLGIEPDRKLQIKSTINNAANTTIGLAPSTNDTVQGGLGVGSGGILSVNAVNTVQFRVGGADGDGASEIARFDSSGNLLVSKTSATTTDQGVVLRNNGEIYATQDGDKCLVLNRKTNDGQIASFRRDNTQVGVISTATKATDTNIFIGSTDVNLYFFDDVNAITPCGSSGADRDNAVDLGRSSVRFKDFYLSGKTYISDGGAGAPAYTFGNDTDTGIFRPTGNQIGFTTGGTEAMRIDSSNRVLIGRTSTLGYKLDLLGDMRSERSAASGTHIVFTNSGGNKGTITTDASGTTYNTTSDIRLKTDIAPISDATDKLMAMNAVTHKWKADPDADAVHGFIAQEMAEIVPEAVSGDPDGEEMMAMDYGRITPVIVAALQEANKKIAELETRIKELETK